MSTKMKNTSGGYKTISVTEYKHLPHHYETCSSKSQTVPDMAYSIRDLYDNHRIPEGLNREFEHEFDEDPSHDDDVSYRTSGFDLSDIDVPASNLRKVKEHLKEQKEKEEKQQIRDALREEIKKELEHELANEQKAQEVEE